MPNPLPGVSPGGPHGPGPGGAQAARAISGTRLALGWAIPRNRRGRSLFALGLLLTISLPSPAGALTYVWIGSDPFSSNWNLILNWSGWIVPPNDGTAEVLFGNTSGSHTPTVNQNRDVYSLTFSSPASYVILSSGGAVLYVRDGGITNATSGTAVNHGFLSPIQLLYHQTWENLADTPTSILSFNGPVGLGPYELILSSKAGARIHVGGAISGTGSVRVTSVDVNSVGVVSFSGPSTYSGGTTIHSTLRAQADNVIPAGPITLSGGTLDLTGHQETIGPGAVNEDGLVMMGGSWVNSPTYPLAISTLGAFIITSADENLVSGKLTLGTSTSTRTIAVTRQCFDFGDHVDLSITADIENPAGVPGPNAAISKSGCGRLRLSGANTFNRAVVVGEGWLQAASDQALGQGGYGNETRVANTGQLELTGGITVAAESLWICGTENQQLVSVAGSNTWGGSVRFDCSGGILVEPGSSLLISGTVEGGSAIAKRGTGVLTLSGANAYFGTTRVIEGELQVTNASGSATGSSFVEVWSGATLSSPGSGHISGGVRVFPSGTIAPGGYGTLAVGPLTLSPGSTTRLKAEGVGPGADCDRIDVAGHVDLARRLEVQFTSPATPGRGDSLVLMTYASHNGAFTVVSLPPLTGGATWELAYEPTRLVARVLGSVGVEADLPRVSLLRSVAPTPFTTRTTAHYQLARAARVELAVFDARGGKASTLVDGVDQPAGAYEVEWGGEGQDGKRLPGGIYFLRLLLDGKAVARAARVVLVR